jgi:hypothetical protein
MQQKIASLRDELSKKEQALRSITGKVTDICLLLFKYTVQSSLTTNSALRHAGLNLNVVP